MIPAFRLTSDAQADLIEIRRYTLQQWGAEQSRKYLREILNTIGLLAETPALGKSRPDVGATVHSFPQGSHIIYYVVHEQQLVVFGVLHKRRAPFAHLAERGLT